MTFNPLDPRTWFGPAFEPVTGHSYDHVRHLELQRADAVPEYAQLEIDSAGWLLGPDIYRFPSVRHSPLRTPHGPVAIVWHATSVKPGTKLWKRIQTYDPKKDRAASWHVIVEADGSLYQSVSFEAGAWHCSAGMIKSITTLEQWRPNACSVGIELAAEEACERPGYVWPAAQIAGADRLVRALEAAYDIKPSQHYAHSELDPKRRGDPGSSWMMDVLPSILGRDPTA